MKSVPADLIVFDELDEATPEAKSMAKERLAHSDFKRIIELSNPSLPDYGIDDAYQRSDQRHWTTKCSGCGHWTSLEKEFPTKLGQEVRIIRPRPDGSFCRACPKCGKELDVGAGEWVADFPGRPIHGYRISQLISSKVDPGDILEEYRTTRYADRFYNLKIGIPWADLERRLHASAVLELCEDRPMHDSGDHFSAMGVDTGRQLHVVIVRPDKERRDVRHVVHIGTYGDFSDLDGLMKRFKVHRCVIDGLPETHATREFAMRHRGYVYLNFFNEHQRGKAHWNYEDRIVQVNRTEALDATRAAVREKRTSLPRRGKVVEEFAAHMAADAKILDEDEETGAKRYRYIRTGPDHYSLAFTYAWLAAERLGPENLSAYGWVDVSWVPQKW
jgi:hypothetical protein